MRSLLFVPGDSARKLEKGLASAADILLIDLEDSVSAANKAEARRVTAAFLADHGADHPGRLFVRANAFDTGLTEADLAAIMPSRPAGIMLPKCAGAHEVEALDGLLTAHEGASGAAAGSTRVLPIITETAAATLNFASYRPGLPRLCGLTWGAEDLSADLGARATRDSSGRYTDAFRLARTVTLLAASASNVPAVDTVFVDFSDAEGFEAECREAERDGYTAKMAIHPAQVAIINRVFTPSPEAVIEAQAIVDAFRAAGDPGVVGIGGKMYDRPHLRRSQRLLDRAHAAGLVAGTEAG
ncbi:MAG: CoA ester lyase [Notoacmeibacter sp.]|nr:CoA ester lyase [Notoacmeibacter sp.]MCC0031865.1 CoA ester lyase [Brucellaceae bacterium]